MSGLKRKLLLNLYSSPREIIKTAQNTKTFVKDTIGTLCKSEMGLEKLIETLDDISDKLCVVTDSTECIRRLHPDQKWKRAAEETFGATCTLMNELNSDRLLATKFMEITTGAEDGVQGGTELAAVIETFKRDFELYQKLNESELKQVARLQEAVETLAFSFEKCPSPESLSKLLKFRFELAKVFGFQSPSEICLRDKQLKTSAAVLQFLKERFEGIKEESGRRFLYTNMKRVMDVLTRLSRDLFDIDVKLKPFNDLGGKLSFKFNVYSAETLLGSILFDLSARNSKDSHPTHYTIKCRKSGQAGLVLISIGISDYEKVSWNQSQSIFHEFGHALHSVLSETRFQVLSGTRGPVDLAEIPSTIFEFIHNSPEIQDELNSGGIFVNVEGNKCRQEEEFQIQIAAIDQLFHSREACDLRDLVAEIESQFRVKTDKRDWWYKLPHLANYGGNYFAYSYSKAAAEKIWNSGFDGRLFRRDFLSKGGCYNHEV